jgi:hypothetical protein
MVLYIIVESRKGDTVLGLGVFYTAFVMQYKKIINMFFLFLFCPTFSKSRKVEFCPTFSKSREKYKPKCPSGPRGST